MIQGVWLPGLQKQYHLCRAFIQERLYLQKTQKTTFKTTTVRTIKSQDKIDVLDVQICAGDFLMTHANNNNNKDQILKQKLILHNKIASVSYVVIEMKLFIM